MKIRLIKENDADRMSLFHKENDAHFRLWEPLRPYDFHGVSAWRKRIKVFLTAQEKNTAMYFVALDKTEEKVIAHCTLSQIIYGAFCACYMGFSVSKQYEGKGVMYQTCLTSIDHAFTKLGIHRIMANYMPHNNRSASLLARLGFVKEGLAKDYLKINGKWENHVLTSLTNTKST